MSHTARFLNLFATPGEVFEDIKNVPASTANWLVPALLLMLVGWVSSYLIFSQDAFKQQIREASEKAVEKQIEKSHMSKAQADAMRSAAEKYSDIGPRIAGAAMPVVFAFGIPFIWGFILWLIGNYALKGQLGYMKAVEIAGLANLVAVLDGITRTLLIMGTGKLQAAASPVLMLKEFDPNNNIHNLMAALSLMTFWVLLVRAIGLSRLTGAPLVKATSWVFCVWLVYSSLFFALGAAFRAISTH